MKKLITLLLCSAIILSNYLTTKAAEKSDFMLLFLGESKSIVNGEVIRVDKNSLIVPVLEKDRTLVPLRFIGESMGYNISYEETIQKISISNLEKQITLQIGNPYIQINGKQTFIDVEPVIKNDRTLVPLRAIAESFNKDVFYEDGLIIIGEQKDIDSLLKDDNLKARYLLKLNQLPYITDGERKALLDSEPEEYYKNNHYDAAVESDFTYGDYTDPRGDIQNSYAKFDIDYAYNIKGNKLLSIKIKDSLELCNTFYFGEEFKPDTILIHKDKLILQGEYFEPEKQASHFVRTIIFDISDPYNLKPLRTFDIEGILYGARRIDNYLYFITGINVNEEVNAKTLKSRGLPLYNTHNPNENLEVPIENLQKMTESYLGYINIVSFDLNSIYDTPLISTYLAGNRKVYLAEKNLYICVEGKDNITGLYKFSFQGGKAKLAENVQINFKLTQYTKIHEYNEQVYLTFEAKNYQDYYASEDYVLRLNSQLEIINKIVLNAYSFRDTHYILFYKDKTYIGTRYNKSFDKSDAFYVINWYDDDHLQPVELGTLNGSGLLNIFPYGENEYLLYSYSSRRQMSEDPDSAKLGFFKGNNKAEFKYLYRFPRSAVVKRTIFVNPKRGYLYVGVSYFPYETYDSRDSLMIFDTNNNATQLADLDILDYFNGEIKAMTERGDILYLITNFELISVNLNDFSIIERTSFPE